MAPKKIGNNPENESEHKINDKKVDKEIVKSTKKNNNNNENKNDLKSKKKIEISVTDAESKNKVIVTTDVSESQLQTKDNETLSLTPKKKRKMRRGLKAIKDFNKYSRKVSPFIPRSSILRLFRKQIEEYAQQSGFEKNTLFSIQKGVRDLITCALCHHVRIIFLKSRQLALNDNKVQIQPKHFLYVTEHCLAEPVF
jgi:histone H3/H4